MMDTGTHTVLSAIFQANLGKPVAPPLRWQASGVGITLWAPKDASFCATECISAVQGHPRSLISAPICHFLLAINNNSNFRPILHRFWNTATYLLAENYELFLPHSHLTPSIRMNPFEFLDECYITKTRVLRLPVSEDFVILVCVI